MVIKSIISVYSILLTGNKSTVQTTDFYESSNHSLYNKIPKSKFTIIDSLNLTTPGQVAHLISVYIFILYAYCKSINNWLSADKKLNFMR